MHGWLIAMVLAATSGCSYLNRTEKGAAAGAAAGGVVGGVIGHQAHSTAKGAIIGAVIGGAAGAFIGHRMDQQAREIQQNIPGAVVERVGEGIEVTFASGLLFDFDSDVIREDAGTNLDELARSLVKYPNSDLLIVGHTDAVGRTDYNLGLSERRARAAASYLRSRAASRYIQTRGRGEAEPVASNDTEAGRQLNRRVEVAIYAGQSLQDQARREAGSR
jgi:outer membrane protein OmpA-like peptidoglycan-associated protein